MKDEKDIQNYIWENRNSWAELIEPLNIEEGDLELTEDLLNIYPELLFKKILKEKVSDLYNKIKSLRLIGNEISLVKNNDSTIRSDLIGVVDSKLAIIELKRSEKSQSEREGITELLGYFNHLNSLLPSLTKDDVFLIIVAPFKNRVLKEAFLHTLLFEQKNIFAFIPKVVNANKLKLHPFFPSIQDITLFYDYAFNKENFDVINLSWYSDLSEQRYKLYNSPKPYLTFNAYMNNISALTSQQMERIGIHGFCYSMVKPTSYGNKYNLVLTGLNPYKVKEKKYETLPEINEIIIGLDKHSSEVKFQGIFKELKANWKNKLIEIGSEIIEFINQDHTDDNKISITIEKYNWQEFEINPEKSLINDRFDIYTTGVIKDFFWKSIEADIASFKENGDHPYHGDTYGSAYEYLFTPECFSDFLFRTHGIQNSNEFERLMKEFLKRIK